MDEVGTDLALEQIQTGLEGGNLELPFFLLLGDDVFVEPFQGLNHMVIALNQLAHLVFSLHLQRRWEFALLQPLEGPGQLFQRTGHPLGEDQAGHQRGNDGHDQNNAHQRGLLNGCLVEGALVHQGIDFPVGIAPVPAPEHGVGGSVLLCGQPVLQIRRIHPKIRACCAEGMIPIGDEHRVKALQGRGGKVEEHPVGVQLNADIGHIVIASVQIDGTHEQQLFLLHIEGTEGLAPGKGSCTGRNRGHIRVLAENHPAAPDHLKVLIQNIDGIDQPGGILGGIEHLRKPVFLGLGHSPGVIGLQAAAEGLVIQKIQMQGHHLIHPGIQGGRADLQLLLHGEAAVLLHGLGHGQVDGQKHKQKRDADQNRMEGENPFPKMIGLFHRAPPFRFT